MSQTNPIPVVDLFAGPGGLGEGISSRDNGGAFRILVSAEMESSAHQTLRLRAFFRILKRQGNDAMEGYYRFCNGLSQLPWDEKTSKAWAEAEKEARMITLGTHEGNNELTGILDSSAIGFNKPWVLIGGPPCQAYSLAGRARNRGKVDYRAEDDHRHFLYKEYLRIIQKYRPAVFVMENVKGILSSKVHDQHIFHTILEDLSDPDFAIKKKSGPGYKIHSLVVPTVFKRGMNPKEIDVHDFIIRAENYGIPQARHRVILFGIREDINRVPSLLEVTKGATFCDATKGLPPLRSRISKGLDTSDIWLEAINKHLQELWEESSRRPDLAELADILGAIQKNLVSPMRYGSIREHLAVPISFPITELDRWYHDSNLKVCLNHEARGHMLSDLRRYLYASAYASGYKKSPKGHEAFDLAGLRPEHKNWETGKFADRFRVQMHDRPATTITSHISKDGHYFIHPDPMQCRSLTVREAARLQTFPDNYFFQGTRTQQFHQVGNAVPPFLAYQIGGKIVEILK